MREDSSPVTLPSWRTIGWIVVGFFSLTFAIYLYPLSHSVFVAWDDTYVIYYNPIVKSVSWKTLKAAFTSYDPELYVPLTMLSYQLDYLIGGLNAAVYHIDNLILHTVNALLVAWLVYVLVISDKRLAVSDKYENVALTTYRLPLTALLTALLFAVHPLNTEAVAWASARKDVLSTFFFLLSIIAYLFYRKGSKRMYLLSLLTFLLGLLAKVMVLTLPVVLLLIDWREKRPWSRYVILEKIPYVALSLLFGIIGLFGKKQTVGVSTVSDKILMAGKSTVFYLEKLFFPLNLSVLYPYDKPIHLSSPDFFVPLIVLVLLIALVLLSLRWTRQLAFGFSFFLVTLVPTFLNFAKGGDSYIASDRYAYVPAIGIFFIIALALETWWSSAVQEHVRRMQRRFALAAAAVVLSLLSVLSFVQAETWMNSISLFRHTLSLYPNAIAARLNLAMVYSQMKQTDLAMEELRAADRIRPHARTHIAFATLYEEKGDAARALAEYEKAVSIDPKDPESYFGIAIIKAKQGQSDEALALYQKVLSIDPRYTGTYNNLGAIYLERGDLAMAALQYRRAIEIDPYYPDAHYNLGIILEQEGKGDEAIAEYERAYELNPPKSLDALDHLLSLYAKKNDALRAADTARRILAIDPSDQTAAQFLEALKERGIVE